MANKILIIDGDTPDIQRMSDHLKQYEIEIFIATNPERGLELFVEEYPDIVFINLMMPTLPGTEIVKRIKNRGEGIKTPCYLMSQIATPSKQLLQDTEIAGIIRKPVDIIEFDNIVRNHFPDLTAPKSLYKANKKPKKTGPSDWHNTVLGRTPFPKLLSQIFKYRATGILAIDDRYNTIRIKFTRGQVSVFTPTAFPKFLSKKGYMDLSEARQFSSYAKSQNVRTEIALAQFQGIEKEKAKAWFDEFLRHIAQDMSNRPKARAVFIDKPVEEEPVVSAPDMIWYAVAYTFDKERLEKTFNKANRRSVPMYLAISKKELLKCSPQVSTVLESVEAGLSLDRMLEEIRTISQLEIYQVLYALLLAGILSFDNEKDKQKTSSEQPLSQDAKDGLAENSLDPVLDILDSIPDEVPTIKRKPRKKNKKRPSASNDKQTSKASEPEPGSKEAGPVSNKEIFNAASKYMNDGSYSKAQICYEELLDRGVKRPEVYVHLGLAIYYNRFSSRGRERLLDVAWMIKKALAINDKYLPAYLTFAKILEKEQKLDMAEFQYRSVLAIDPQNVKASAALKRITR